MATYKQIFGKQVKFLSSDPANEAEGQVWYNSTSGTFKTVLVSEAWSSSAALSTGRGEMASGGTQTASIASFGGTPSNTNAAEEYNGSGWATLPNGNTARRLLAATAQGTPSAFMAIGGYTTTYSNLVEEYNGSSWTANPTINTARYSFAGGGTATSALAFGGDVPGGPRSNASETWNGSSWTATPSLSTARNGIAGCGGSNTAGLAFGGDAGPPGEVTATEEYNGTSWTAGGSLPVAMSPTGAGIQTSALAVGGAPAPNNAKTFSYDGSSWTAVADLGTGRNVNRAAGAGNTAGLAMGGYPGLTTTEEYNRSADVTTAAAWAAGGSISTARQSGSTFGTQTAAAVVGGEASPGANTTATEEYDGASWTAGGAYPSPLINISTAGTQTAGFSVGGTPPTTNVSASYNGTAWTAGTVYPISVYECCSTGTVPAGLVTGGNVSGTVFNTTNEYASGSWTSGGNLNTARASFLGAGTQTASTITTGNIWPSPGATAEVDVTEEYNGTGWTTGNAMLESSNGNGGAAGTGSDFIIFGMGGLSTPGTVYGYDGTNWSTRPSLGTGRYSAGGCGTATAALCTSGRAPAYSTAVEEFTGDTTAANYKTITTS